jgi:hypothetical protein
MSSKEIKTYKPKQSNIVKLEAYLKQIKDHGKQHKLGKDIRK